MKNKNIFIIVFTLISLVFYILTVKGAPGNFTKVSELSKSTIATGAFESSHERSTYSTMLSLIQRRRFDLSNDLADFSTPDVGYLKGKFISYFPPGISVTILPFYVFFSRFGLGQVGGFFTMSVFALLSIGLLYLISRDIFKLPVWISVLVPLIFSFATVSWSYSITIYQHTMLVFLLLLSFYSIWRGSRSEKFSFIWGAVFWICIGISPFFDYPNPILMAPLVIYFLVKAVDFKITRRDFEIKIKTLFLFSVVAFAAMIGILFFYNQKVLGNWKRLSNNLPRYEIKNLAQLIDPSLVPAAQRQRSESAKLSTTFLEERVPTGLDLLIITKEKGIFVFSPILLLSILGFLSVSGAISLEIAVLAAIVLLNILLYASFGDPWGGWAYGPRYLVPSMAIMPLFIALWLNQPKHLFLKKISVFILFIYSSAVALIGALTTAADPPKVEAVYLKIKYGVDYALDYLLKGKSSSFFYNSFAYKHVSLIQYFFILWITLIVIAFIVLFIAPMFEKNEH